VACRPVRQNLLYIPHEFLGLPVFGFGWLLIVWVALSGIWLALLVRRQGWNADTLGYLPILAIVAVAIVAVLPKVEVANAAGELLGVPIRGYGLMLLLGCLAGMLLAAWRAKQMGVKPELVFSMGFWLVVCGIAGARLFHVIQYWDQLTRDAETLGEMAIAIFDMTSGGLVIYGGMIGGVGAAFVYLLIKRAPVLAIADIMAPSLALGLALGRLGCFFNGCCFGGACEYPWAVTFPYASPPYVDQYQKDKLPTPATLFKHDSGGLQPIELRVNENGRPIVYYVHPKAEFQGSTPRRGEVVTDINGRKIESYRQAAAILLSDPPPFRLKTAAGREVSWSKLIEPPRSLPIHPTQIYSTINGIFPGVLVRLPVPSP